MIKKIFLTTFFFFLPTKNFGQFLENTNIQFGTGTLFWGSGDITLYKFETEFTKKWNTYISNSISLVTNYDGKPRDGYEAATVLQGNLNLFVSPFGNDGENNFKIGLGISRMHFSETRFSSLQYIGNVFTVTYSMINRSSFGAILLLEDEYRLNEKIFIGLGVATQIYHQDIGHSLKMKLGIVL